MRTQRRAAVAVVATLFMVAIAHADFVGATVELVEDDGPEGVWTWRVYAHFNDPTDVLLAIGGIPNIAAVTFEATADLFNDAGAFEGLKAGDFPSFPIGSDRDSYLTLGFDSFGGGDLDYSPNFTGVPTSAQAIQGSAWSEDNGGWFDTDPGTPVSGEQILVGQFTLASGSHFTLSGLANWQTFGAERITWSPDLPVDGFTATFFQVSTAGLQEGACCQSDGTCIETTAGTCELGGGSYQGDDTSCEPNPCPMDGACCLNDGTCTIGTPASCADVGGIFTEVGVSCLTADCPQPGACCFSDGTCTLSTELSGADCSDAGGVYQGDDTTCAAPCPAPGACCFDDGTCTQATELGGADCTAAGGVYQGDDTTCAAPCPDPGACCFDDGSCTQATELGGADCTAAGGVYQGDDTTCNPCPPPGACCYPSGVCAIAGAAACASVGGVFQGSGTTCLAAECSGPVLVDASLELVQDDGPGGNWTWRVFIDFDVETTLLAIGATPELGDLAFEADSAIVNDGDVLAGFKGEDFPAGELSGPRDSWITIGDDLSLANTTDYTPGFAGADGIRNVIKGVSLSESNGGWFNNDPGIPATGVHVLIGQFTVASGENFTLQGFAFWSTTESTVIWSPETAGLFEAGFFSVSVLADDDGACCSPDGTCAEATSGVCTFLGGTFQGAGTTCDATECPQPLGACCFRDGSCAIVTGAECAASGGAFAGDGVGCEAVICPQPGACCFPDGACEQATAPGGADCTAAGGVYQGDETICNPCPQPGACCFPDGSCEQSTVVGGAECTAAGGVYQGDDTSCNPCPQPGACCFLDGSCTQQTEIGGTACLEAGGFYQGDGTTCESMICPQPGACCFPDGSCALSTELSGADCMAAGGVYQGDDTTCESTLCRQPGACCFPDGSCALSTELSGADCTAADGVYQGVDTSCDTVACPQPGACCLSDGACVQSTLVGGADCADEYQGDNTVCGTVMCPPPSACCFADESCTLLTPTDCAAAGGAYQGDETMCGLEPCPPFGACCHIDGSCSLVTEVDCASAGGTYQGDETVCGTDLCPPAGACCMPEECLILTEAACEAVGGDYEGDETVCDPDPCPGKVRVPEDYPTIQEAIDAVEDGDQVMVAPGVYRETIDLRGKAIVVCSEEFTDPDTVAATIVDGTGLDGAVVKCVSGEGPGTVIIGLTITGGHAEIGAGMRITNSSPTIAYCVFIDNQATAGGGIASWNSAPSVYRCRFEENTARLGAGMYNEDSSPQLLGCTFLANTAVRSADLVAAGGGMFNRRGAPELANCGFFGNIAEGGGFGGGGAMYNWASGPIITNSTFTDNGVDVPGDTGGILNAGASTAVITNCIVWHNASEAITDRPDAVTTVSYSTVEGGCPGIGNLDVDPVFADPDGADDDPATVADNDYRLALGSPCVDAADNRAVSAEVACLDLNPRFLDDPATLDTGVGTPPIVDMGAYERDARCAGDVDGSGVIDGTDVYWVYYAAVLQEAYGDYYPVCDLDGNGVVDVDDVMTVLDLMGTDC